MVLLRLHQLIILQQQNKTATTTTAASAATATPAILPARTANGQTTAPVVSQTPAAAVQVNGQVRLNNGTPSSAPSNQNATTVLSTTSAITAAAAAVTTSTAPVSAVKTEVKQGSIFY